VNSADAVTITTITENYVDMLLAHELGVERAGLAHHFDSKRTCPIGENGLALHVEVEYGGGRRCRVLFDTGMSYAVLAHNAAALGIDLDQVDHVVISHGHPDHYGGLLGMLKQRSAPVPVAIHEEAFAAR
jgi:7,8-dihydropterin-6-yl-methyl-4-(beta-D-ribofuranosyl)aminobenzene 5'-phosphate synthase